MFKMIVKFQQQYQLKSVYLKQAIVCPPSLVHKNHEEVYFIYADLRLVRTFCTGSFWQIGFIG